MEIKASAQAEWDLLQTDLISPGRLHIRLLGDFELLQNGVPLPRTRTRTERWLLALLVLRANQEVNRTWLAGTFWPDTSPEQALNNLRRSLSNLRQVLGEEAYRLLSPTTATITFDLAGALCDVAAFDAALAQGEAHKEAERGIAALRQAAASYRGSLLPDCEADWLLEERESREQACLKALETLAHQARQNGDAQEAGERLRHALRIDPFRETTQCALMEALAAQGDRAAMTLSYRQFRLLLHEELQSEPAAETKALYLRLREEKGQAKQQASEPLTEDTFPLHIPHPISALVGRKEESEAVAALLSNTRLVTLTGVGGIGKTRLAIAAAEKTLPDFPDGVWFVDLTPLADASLVATAVATKLGVREDPNRALIETLTDYLAPKRLLLVLDNCEHLLPGCAQFVNRLLQGCPHLRILATSRQALGLRGETVWRVPSLSLPPGNEGDRTRTSLPSLTLTLLESDAARLFLERAMEASTGFALTERNAGTVAQICRRLDGIPLAIELAAARVKVLSVEQIARRLNRVFTLLTGGNAADLPRHQTLRAMLDWSYALLDNREKTLLCRLSVFAGGWTLEAAEAVGSGTDVEESEVLDLLTSLVDKSLVMAEPQEEETRYRLLETVRQYAQERLIDQGAGAEVQSRHRDYFLAFAEEAAPNLQGPQHKHWLEALETEHDNLRQALAFCLEETEGGEAGVRLVAALGRFWQVRGHYSEGRAHLTTALERAEGAEKQRLLRARALNCTGIIASIQCDYGAARALLEESLTIRRELGDKPGIASSLNNLGNVAFDQGDYGVARPLYEESLTIRRELGDRLGIAACLDSFARLARQEQQVRRALRLWGAETALREIIEAPRPPEDQEQFDRESTVARSLLGEPAFTTAFFEGRAMTMEQAIAYALEKPA